MEVPGKLVDLIFGQWLAGDSGPGLVVDRPLVLAASKGTLSDLGRHFVDVGLVAQG